MSLHPKPASNPDSIEGALWLNGFVWSVILLCYMHTVAANDDGYHACLGPFLFGVATAGLGMVVNGYLCLWRQSTTSRQSMAYGRGGLLLAGVFFWAMSELSHIGKIGG